MAIESLGPLLVAAVAANLTLTAVLGFAPVYHMPAFTLPHTTAATLALAGLGLLGGLAAPGYLWLLDRGPGRRRLVDRQPFGLGQRLQRRQFGAARRLAVDDAAGGAGVQAAGRG